MNLKHMLHGNSKHEAIERYIILGIIVGVILVGIGTAATIFQTKGATTAIALVGSFITFVLTVVLVFYWLVRGDRQ